MNFIECVLNKYRPGSSDYHMIIRSDDSFMEVVRQYDRAKLFESGRVLTFNHISRKTNLDQDAAVLVMLLG